MNEFMSVREGSYKQLFFTWSYFFDVVYSANSSFSHPSLVLLVIESDSNLDLIIVIKSGKLRIEVDGELMDWDPDNSEFVSNSMVLSGIESDYNSDLILVIESDKFGIQVDGELMDWDPDNSFVSDSDRDSKISLTSVDLLTFE